MRRFDADQQVLTETYNTVIAHHGFIHRKQRPIRMDIRYRVFRTWRRVKCRIENTPLVYIVGDSHVLPYRGQKSFLIYHFGPATAYRLPSADSSTQSHRQLLSVLKKMNRKCDILVLVFGELDCRIHIYNQHMKSGGVAPISNLIEGVVRKYATVLSELRDMQFRFIVHGITPAALEENIYNYPFYGCPNTRARISKEFNDKLRELCTESGYLFFDIYSHLADSNGMIRRDFSTDGVHVDPRNALLLGEWIREELEPCLSK